MAQNNVGGIASKLGNSYEAKWLILQLLEVIRGEFQCLHFESISSAFAGFEATVHKQHIAEWHQTKINAPNGSWTVSALEREGVLTAFANRLRVSTTDRCVFVSQDPARDIRTMTERAHLAERPEEFVQSLSKKEHDQYGKLKQAWGVDDSVAQLWLQRCEFLTIPASQIDNQLEAIGSLLFEEKPIYGALRVYLEQQFNKPLTTERVRRDLRASATTKLKHWQLDPTLSERIRATTDAYLETHAFRRDAIVARKEVDALEELLLKKDGPKVVVLTGVAGGGKSGVVRGLIGRLREREIMALAFRVDHHVDAHTTSEIGQWLIGRDESPSVTLQGISPVGLAVLIADQVDAVSDASGRSGPAKSAILRLIGEVDALKSIKLVLVCRTFDFRSDARLKQLEQGAQTAVLDVQLLEWASDVEPLLKSLRMDAGHLTAAQRELLCLPLNLGLFIELSGEGSGFTSRGDLFEALLYRKEQSVRRRGAAWNVYQPLDAAVAWMSERQRLDAPIGCLDAYQGAIDVLRSEHLISVSRGKIALFHESLFDHLYARRFSTQMQSLHGMLTTSEQHLFRRTQSRQILEALRQLDRPRYLTEMREVMHSRFIRFHIKHAIAHWVGSLDDPSREEFEIVIALDNREASFTQLVSLSLMGSAGWFDLLLREGWISDELSGNSDRQERLLRWLWVRVRDRPAETVVLLETWWSGDAERGQLLLRWLSHVGFERSSEEVTSFCERVIKATGAKNLLSRNDMILATWVGRSASEGARILRALTDAWFDAHPDKHPFEIDEIRDIDLYNLGELSKKSPVGFLEGATPMLVRSLDVIARRKARGEHDYTFSQPSRYGESYSVDKLIAIYRVAICSIAAQRPDEARRLLFSLDPALHPIVLHLHLEAIAASKGYAGFGPSCASKVPRRSGGLAGCGVVVFCRSCSRKLAPSKR